MSEIDINGFWDAYYEDKLRTTFPARFFNIAKGAKENTKFIVIVYNNDREILTMNLQTFYELEMVIHSNLWNQLKGCSCKILSIIDGDDKVLVNKRNGNYREPAIVQKKMKEKKEDKLPSWMDKVHRLLNPFHKGSK